MWRGVLAWGQAKAGVQSSVKQWTENDRSKMKQVLNVSMHTLHISEALTILTTIPQERFIIYTFGGLGQLWVDVTERKAITPK